MAEQSTFLDSLLASNVFRKFKHLLDEGWYIDPKTKKFTPGKLGIDWRRNWIFTHPDPVRTCDLYQTTFNVLGFVPTKCINCWKVVVKMPTVKHLIDLWGWQREFGQGDRWCKCGIEERPYVHYQYGGYFYCDSKGDGLVRHQQVVDGLSKLFGVSAVKTIPGSVNKGKVEVILKRYCTEFELKAGPTDQYLQPDNVEFFEKRIAELFDVSKINATQPDYLIEDILLRWLEFAYDRGDQTALHYNGGKPFYNPVVTYHGKEDI